MPPWKGVCVCVGGEGKERSTRVERLLSASLACGRPAAMQALAYCGYKFSLWVYKYVESYGSLYFSRDDSH